MIKLYRAFSRVPNQDVIGNWFCKRREQSVASYQELIRGYRRMNETEKRDSESCVDELFTAAEVEELRKYLADHGVDALDVWEENLPLPFSMVGQGHRPLFEGEYYYRLDQEKDYNLSIPIWAFVSSVCDEDEKELWDRYMGEDVDMEECSASGWDMTRLRRDLHAKGLTGRKLAEVADEIAAVLENHGCEMTDATKIESVTLSTAHWAAKYHKPVLLIGNSTKPTKPADITPAGMTGAELVSEWAARYATPELVDELLSLLRTLWDRRISWSRSTRDFFIVTIPADTSAWIRRILGEAKGTRRDKGMPLRTQYGEYGPNAYPFPDPNSGDPPVAFSVVRAALHRALPDTCRPSYFWPDAGGDWVMDLVDQTGEVIGQVAVFAPPFDRRKGAMPVKSPKAPEYHATLTSTWDRRLLLICEDENEARPWVQLLTGAGLALDRRGAGGRYLFAVSNRSDLEAPSPTSSPPAT